MSEQAWRVPTGAVDVSWDDETFVEYVRARSHALMRTAFLLTGDLHDAEDLFQTTLVKLYAGWDRVTDPASLNGYVRRIMVNANNSAWRRPWRRREVPGLELVGETADGQVTDPDATDLLADLVMALPPKQRMVIVLRYYEDLPATDIAELMGISPGTVRSQANRAIATLRTHPDLANLEDWA